jgi:hypothetical protein
MTAPPRKPAERGQDDVGGQAAPSLEFDAVPGPGPGQLTYGVGDLGFVLDDVEGHARTAGRREAVDDDAAGWW